MSSPHDLFPNDAFLRRHIGPRTEDEKAMLSEVGQPSLAALMDQTIPKSIRNPHALDLPDGMTERQVISAARDLAKQNQIFKSYIGMGYHSTLTPTVILRNVLENPGWYTAYTPYQAEIAQGRLEALLNFQTMVSDLTGLPIANASLLDEGTAAAEAMYLAYQQAGDDKRKKFFVTSDCHPQTIEVVQTRAEPLGIKVVIADHREFRCDDSFFGVLLQYPGTCGRVEDFTSTIAHVHSHKALAIVAADILSLCLLKSPGEMNADIAVGTTQRFGVPMGFGGPHAAYLSTKDSYKRSIPGRIVGLSIDSQGHPALRLALQTREQHIRREKATSNICTAQVLLAVMASMYAVYHGPQGLRRIAERTHHMARVFAAGLKKMSWMFSQTHFFDTVQVVFSQNKASEVLDLLRKKMINARLVDAHTLSFSFDEVTTKADLELIWSTINPSAKLLFDQIESSLNLPDSTWASESSPHLPAELRRKSAYLTHPTFNSYHSETEMLRYIHRLEGKDLSLTHSMIPLGSCTMKLNATSEMIPVTWPEVAHIHPFAPLEQAQGYLKMIRELEGWLAEVTGFSAVSLQPNAGSQGEYAGLLAVRRYHQSRSEGHRNICLIPSSAHGTNPASAVMAGMQVVVVACDSQGNVDVADLKAKAELHASHLAALMITYPSTHGVFEESIREISDVVHKFGGQVYMDGANFNALVGLCRPGDFGPDVCHLNLHKTFCIPHGGGGPGIGPIGVREHLRAFLPGHQLRAEIATANKGQTQVPSAVSAAPWGSASILWISWAYIAMMGREGLKHATEVAILNANYIAKRLAPHYPIVYRGRGGMVAHECIVDIRPLKASAGIEVEDVAKRLMDYGFHAPTMSWPVAGTLMIEPTESESKAELDRFCDAMIAIRAEVSQIETGKWPRDNNPLKHAPHTMQDVTRIQWDRPYTREQAAFPLKWVSQRKFWPTVGRINNAHGDRNLVCACPPMSEYES